MLEKIILFILVIDTLFITIMSYVYFRDKDKDEKIRNQSLDILLPIIKNSVTESDIRMKEERYIPKDTSDYIDRLYDLSVKLVIDRLYNINDFSYIHVNYEEIEYRIRLYINKNVTLPKITNKPQMDNKKEEITTNKTDITEYLYT